MHIGMEKTVTQSVAQERLDNDAPEAWQIMTGAL
jgi:hypothetical protein